MPYCNFDDTHSLDSTFAENKQCDLDMNIGEFLFNKLFTIGELFDQGDDDEDEPKLPTDHHQPIPIQVQPLQSGSLFCIKINVTEQEKQLVLEKPSCIFKDKMFSFDFHASVFHPPAISC
jgi:hypothetical protein